MEIQNLTDAVQWRYVDSANNTQPHRWNKGPDFLYQPVDQWPTMPSAETGPDLNEQRKSTFVGTISNDTSPQLSGVSKFTTWNSESLKLHILCNQTADLHLFLQSMMRPKAYSG